LQFKSVSQKHAVFSVRVGIRWRALEYRDVELADYDKLVAGL